MKLEERVAAVNKYGIKLIGISGVNGVETGNYGIVIQVEKRSPELEQKIQDFMEKEAVDLAYAIKEVGKKEVKLPGSRKYDKVAKF